MRRVMISVLMGLLMCISMTLMVGCGKQGSEIEGTWTLQAMEIGEQKFTLQELADAVGSDAAADISVILIVEPDGHFLLAESPDEADALREDDKFHGTYTEEDEGWLFHVEGQNDVKGTLEDGNLILHDTEAAVETKMILEKK